MVPGGSVALYVQSDRPRNTTSANSTSAHKSIFKLRSSNILDVRRTNLPQEKRQPGGQSFQGANDLSGHVHARRAIRIGWCDVVANRVPRPDMEMEGGYAR